MYQTILHTTQYITLFTLLPYAIYNIWLILHYAWLRTYNININTIRNKPDIVRKLLLLHNAEPIIVNDIIKLDNEWRMQYTLVTKKYSTLNCLLKYIRNKIINDDTLRNQYNERLYTKSNGHRLNYSNEPHNFPENLKNEIYNINISLLSDLTMEQLLSYLNYVKYVIFHDNNNMSKLESSVINKINIIGNIINKNNLYDVKRKKKHYNRPY
jgi:hypothetical protein